MVMILMELPSTITKKLFILKELGLFLGYFFAILEIRACRRTGMYLSFASQNWTSLSEHRSTGID